MARTIMVGRDMKGGFRTTLVINIIITILT